jgi:hypothetical protein
MAGRLFRVTDAFKIPQFRSILKVLRAHGSQTTVCYQSNYHMIIVCPDIETAYTIRAQLSRIDNWDTEIRPGRKNTVRQYLKVTFHKEPVSK